jgi:hypothetical protein
LQKLSHASTAASATLCGVHERCAKQKPHALQSQRAQWTEACFSLQYSLQLSTFPSSLNAEVHMIVGPDLGVKTSAAGEAPGAWQMLHIWQSHRLQCVDAC